MLISLTQISEVPGGQGRVAIEFSQDTVDQSFPYVKTVLRAMQKGHCVRGPFSEATSQH